MRKIINTIFFVASFALVISCADDSLDPYQIKKMKKGTMLALRGDMFNNIYNLGLPGAEFFPTAITGDEIFNFDAEYLSDDPNTLESFDIYIVKKTKVGNNTTRERIFFRNVPFTEFQTTEDYSRPWVSVSLDFEEILNAIGITLPLDQTEVDLLLDTYKAGINIESDLNLTDGSHVYAAQIVSGSLFGSDQFYPAQKLTYTVTNYCEEDLEGTYSYESSDNTWCDGIATGNGTLTRIGVGRYSISDASFGQFDCAYGDDPSTGVNMSNFCDLIAFGGRDQYGDTYTISGASVSGGGTILSFKWESSYGDGGTVVLTRTDDKLWPSSLHSE